VKKKSYKLREGARVRGSATPDEVAEELERIRSKYDDKLRPTDILRESRPSKAVLRDCFEWDNAVAGHEYRLSQARHLTRSVIVVVVEDGKTTSAPKYVHVAKSEKEEGYYQEIDVLVQNVDEFRLALTDALSRLHAAEYAVKVLREKAKGRKVRGVSMIDVAMKSIKEASSAIDRLAAS
jgi:hypothetical protein